MRSALLFILTSFAATPVIAQSSRPRVTTADGIVAGLALPSGVRVFRGVPFAAPPTRDLRWKPPQRAKHWEGVRDADRFAAQCMQARLFSDMVFRNDAVSEDCLYLNVWTPSSPRGEKMPVLVYFFGGGFRAGDGSEFRYDGESMAKRGIVVVTTSYRLGIFGFFAHPELTRESARHASGNYALMDQTAALRWVQANIARFGGDPHRVTIAGESAGSYAVSAQMASPGAKGLFAGAIGESGSLLGTTPTPTLAESEQKGVRFGAAAGANSLTALRAMSAIELLDATNRAGAIDFGPNVDGDFLPESPTTIYDAGKQAHVPLLAGWNSEEFGPWGVLKDPPTPANVAQLLTTTFGPQASQASRVYPASTNDEAVQAATDIASDKFIAYSTWKWLDEQSRTGRGAVYRYLFARARPTPIGAPAGSTAPRGAVHSAEIEFALGNLTTNHVYAWTPDDYRVSDTMQQYFANFVKTGQPNGAGLPHWPIGTVGADGRVERMRIDVDSHAEVEPSARYLFLDRFYSQTKR